MSPSGPSASSSLFAIGAMRPLSRHDLRRTSAHELRRRCSRRSVARVYGKGSRLHCIVFSRDRALQLDAFLTSLSLHAGEFLADVTVLYRPTSERHADAY